MANMATTSRFRRRTIDAGVAAGAVIAKVVRNSNPGEIALGIVGQIAMQLRVDGQRAIGRK